MSRRQKLKKYLRWSMRKKGCVEREFLWKNNLLRERQINKLFPLASIAMCYHRDGYLIDERDILNVFKQKYRKFDVAYYKPLTITSELLRRHAAAINESIEEAKYKRSLKP